MSISEKYKKHTQISHVLERPGMYIGSIQNCDEEQWIISKNNDDLIAIKKQQHYNPGLEQCCVELLINAVDHEYRCITQNLDLVTKIDVTITDELFTIYNNGQGLPIEIHNVYGIYVPELIFGNMLTSSNYDDNEKKIVGGQNGIGAKAANIFSKEFIIEVVTNGRKYIQTFSDNLSKKTEPKITKVTKQKDYTKITFRPDFARFGLKSFIKDLNDKNNDTKNMVIKRVYDASAMTTKKVIITINDEKIPIKDFKDYVSLYLPLDNKKIFYEIDRWSICVSLNPFDNPTIVSFVNGLYTYEGGRHEDHILDQIVKKLKETIENLPKVKKEGLTIKPGYIKDRLIVFIKCQIENPRFNSQTKRKLETSVNDFGSKCSISDEIITKISKLGLVEEIIDFAKARELSNLKKQVSTTRISKILDIPKLEDAQHAGTKKSLNCTLILTEGDSAASTARAGVSIVGNDYWGIFPLKGKILNIRGATIKQLSTNEEIINIKKILGLNHDMTDKSKLRYGQILILTDQDQDGYHIKGLLMNFFTFFWPTIVEDSFMSTLLTPLVKIWYTEKKKNIDKIFYNLNDFKAFLQNNTSLNYKQKYYKGLATSTKEEAKDYFRNIAQNKLEYTYNSISNSDDNVKIKLAFDKDQSNERKEWILNSITKLNNNSSGIDYTKKKVSISSFIDNELIMFSIYDNKRSLPNILDGLKISQRKILYASIEKKIFNEDKQIKVAQLGSYVAEKTEYHHGEISLQETIIKLAQDFVGCGSAPLFVPIGAFGTRYLGGLDAGSPRYIHTCLKPWIPIMFNSIDSELLEYNYEDSIKIEPTFYIPVLPLILLNGSIGIGTGWSSEIPCFKPKDIIDNIRNLLIDDEIPIKQLEPYYKGFNGIVKKISDNKWTSIGKFNRINNTRIVVIELPIGLWYKDFKNLLEKLELDNSLTHKIKIYEDSDKNEKYEFDITFNKTMNDTEIINVLSLSSIINTTNMVGFDRLNSIKRYNSPEEILWEFFQVRIEFYNKRYNYIINKLTNDFSYISEKMRFIKLVIDSKIIINRKTKEDIIKQMSNLNFNVNLHDGFLRLSLYSFTEEKLKELENEMNTIKKELDTIKNKNHKDLWLEDLLELEKYF